MRILEKARKHKNGSVVSDGKLIHSHVYSPNTNPYRRKSLLVRKKDSGFRARKRAAAAKQAINHDGDVDHTEDSAYMDEDGPLVDHMEVRCVLTARDIYQEIFDLVNNPDDGKVDRLMEESPEKADDTEVELESDVGFTPQAKEFNGELQAAQMSSIGAIVEKYASRYIHAASGKRKAKLGSDDGTVEGGDAAGGRVVVNLDEKDAVQALFDSRLGPWTIKSTVSST